MPVHFDPRVDLPQHGVEPRHTAQHRVLANNDARTANLLRGHEAAGQIAGADVFGERLRDIASERCVESRAVLRANLAEQRRHRFFLTIAGETALC